MKEMQDNLDQHGASLVRIENKLEEDPWCHKNIYNIKQKCLQCIYKQLKTFCQAILTSKTPTCLILMYLIIMVWIKHYEISQLDCISEQYSFLFKQDLPLLGYLSEHEILAGRKWLIKELEDEVLFTKNETVRAFLVVAELGYGKSALVFNMLCPETKESASILYKHIVAFHVCRFDVRSTHYAERFIRRLVGFLAMKSGEYGNIISMLPESSMLYDRDSCDKEPDACFDQGITLPLKQISEVEHAPWLIVVDALDECEHSGNNQILNMLSSRMNQLPKWLRFLIMSRNITSLHTLKKTKIKYLSASDSRNIDDIRAFIYQSLLKDTSSQVIDSLIERSDGNFMYIIHASKLIAEHRDKTGRSFDLPKDLGDIYEINFDRQFEKEHSYTIPKKILEIVCSTLNPLNKQEIFTILKYNGVLEDISEFNLYFQSLSFFLRVGRDVQIAHQALNRWLISEQNGNYRISLQEGHAQISRYLFSTMKNNQQKNLVNLAIHSAESADPAIQKIFVSLKLNDDADFKRESNLHQLIWRTPSAKALSLLLNYYPEVDVKNEGNVTPAFVASGSGHVEQLELLHRKGADLGLTVSGNFTIRAFNVLRNIEILKQRFYSGYSLLHIAAQHGHTSVVRYLLKHKNSIINKTDTLGLNAGDIACENGHLDVIVIIFNINPKLIGYKCLFHAAKNNHLNVIDWLLRHGEKINCVSDKDAEVAINVIFGNVPFVLPIAIFPNESETYIYETVNPLDEWWTVFKINPIHVAIRMGSNDVAEYLISKFPDELNCVDAWGYTAALTSVLYNRTDLLPLVKEHLVSDRCGKVSVHIEMLSPYVSEDIDTSVCPEGGGFAHIVALHDVKEVAIYSWNKELNIEWNKPDNLGNYPIHYAAANKNLVLMVIFERRQFSHENTRALNGSTSFHIAAITGQYYFIYFFSQSLELSFPDLRDKRNRGLLHYTVMRLFSDNQIRPVDALQYVSMSLFEYFSDKCNHDLNSLDDYGRSVLHYALRYGHFLVVSYLMQSHPIVLNIMLYKRDKAGLNPIKYALLEYQKGSQSLVFPKNCAFFNVFSTLCANSSDFSRILSPFERGLIYLTESFTPSEFFQFLEPNLEHIVKKSVYILVNVLANNYKHLNVQVLKGILMITYKHDPFMKFKHFAIARYKPEIFRVCGKLLSKSPLHFLMLNGEFKHSAFSFNQRDVDVYLDLIFRTNRSLLSCEDSSGYNVFHYSLIGGNIMAGRILMRRKINTVNNHISFKDVFMLALLSRENSDPDNFMNCNRESFYQSQKDCTDIFLLEYFKTNRKHLLPIDFCKNRSSELSLVHLLSANGMKRTLEIVVDTFGSDVLSCINRHDITPLYLGKLFDQTSVVRFIEDRVKSDFPDKDTEEWLLWLLVNVFPDVNAFGNLLCLSHYASFNVLTYRKLRNEFSCIEKMLMTIYQVPDKTIIWTNTYLLFTLQSLQYLLLRFDFFENALHSHDRQECMNLHLLLNQSYYGLEYVCLLNKTDTLSETSLYKTSKRLRQTFKIIVDKADIAVKRYLQKFPTDLCHTSNTSMRKGKMIYMYKSATNIFYLMRNWLKEAAIHLLMQASKSVKVEVRGDFAFLRERMHVLQFPTSDKEKQHGAVALITDSLIYINKYKYLHILKPSLVYKDLKRNVSRDYFGRHDFPKFETKLLEFINLQEPFKNFQNHSSSAKSHFYN